MIALSPDAVLALYLLMGAAVGGVCAVVGFVISLVNSSEEESDSNKE